MMSRMCKLRLYLGELADSLIYFPLMSIGSCPLFVPYVGDHPFRGDQASLREQLDPLVVKEVHAMGRNLLHQPMELLISSSEKRPGFVSILA